MKKWRKQGVFRALESAISPSLATPALRLHGLERVRSGGSTNRVGQGNRPGIPAPSGVKCRQLIEGALRMKSVTRLGVGLWFWARSPCRASVELKSIGSRTCTIYRARWSALRDVQNTGRLIFAMADANHDGLVSQQEAIDANNLLVGGFFFRADADCNGVVTEPEAKAVVDKYLDQNPWLKYVVQSLQSQARAKQNNGQEGHAARFLPGFRDPYRHEQRQQADPGDGAAPARPDAYAELLRRGGYKS